MTIEPVLTRKTAGLFFPDGVFAEVTDGCSEPHFLPGAPPFMYPGGFTGGQMVSRIVSNAFSSALSQDSLKDIVRGANEEVWRVQKRFRDRRIRRNDAGTLASASFSCVKLDKAGSVEVVWGADVFTIWQTRSGEVSIAGGENMEVELERERTYHDLVQAAGKDPKKQQAAKREYFLDIFPEIKRQQDNVVCAVLNGSLDFTHRWNTLAVQEASLFVLLSDGAWLPVEKWGDKAAAESFISKLRKGGLVSSLEWIREEQRKGMVASRIMRPEATALAVFLD